MTRPSSGISHPPDGPLTGADDFRDHLSTSDAAGKRLWLYPKQPRGRYYRWRTYVSYVLLLILLVVPFVRIDGNPLLMVNIMERKFILLGQIFWPQDFHLFALAMLIFLTMVVVFTAVFGRVWCGWLCPQTLFMEMVFRKIEYFLEGDAHEHRVLDAAPWTPGKWARKSGKHAVFFGLSFGIGNLLLAYIVGSDQLWAIVTDPPAQHLKGLTAMILFTLLFYAIFARFREQACTFVCPYGRLQSTLLDEHSLVVAYDYKRGEGRRHWSRGQDRGARRGEGIGDCVDCHLCVAVCPTGIDIRNGTQMECVHCTACMDACDSVMRKLKWPLGLVRYASLNGIEQGEGLKLTPSIGVYGSILVGLGLLLGFLLVGRTEVETTLLRAPGSLFTRMPDGMVSNLYLLKLMNKTNREIPVDLRLVNGNGRIQIIGGNLRVPPEHLKETSVMIELPPAQLSEGTTPVAVDVYADGEFVETMHTVFVGPGADSYPSTP